MVRHLLCDCAIMGRKKHCDKNNSVKWPMKN